MSEGPASCEGTQQVLLCRADELFDGEVRRVAPPGLPPIAVFYIKRRYYATADTCTHGRASLSEGWVDGENIECPFHGGTFHIPSGRPVYPPCVVPLRTYPVKMEDDCVFAVVE
jgi:nitrite reductase/ring-hydroxylating ferredoxin subunit